MSETNVPTDATPTTPPGSEGPASSASRESTESTVDWSKPRVTAILRAAVRCFARSGFDTTTAEIAAEIGIPKSVIYHYFDDKTTLVREAQRFAYAEHLAKVKETLSQAGEQAQRSVLDVLRKVWQAPQSRKIAFELGIWSELRNDARVREQAVALRRDHHRLVANAVASSLGIDASDPARTEPLSTLIVAALTGLSLNAFIEGDDKLATEAHEEFMTLLERGIERFAKRPDSEIPPSFGAPESSISPPAYDQNEQVTRDLI
jgi:AcrR family transcriptional regulator